jgi:hypothetical protein
MLPPTREPSAATALEQLAVRTASSVIIFNSDMGPNEFIEKQTGNFPRNPRSNKVRGRFFPRNFSQSRFSGRAVSPHPAW